MKSMTDITELCQCLRSWNGKVSADAADALEAQAQRIAELEEIITVLKECMDDRWECERCGHSEPWWTGSNADYMTRALLAEVGKEL